LLAAVPIGVGVVLCFATLVQGFLAVVQTGIGIVEALVIAAAVELVLHVYSFLPHKPQKLVYLFGSYKLVVAARDLDKVLKVYKLSKASGDVLFPVLHVDFLVVVVPVEVIVVVELVLHVYSFLPHKPQRLVYLFGSYKLVVAARDLDKVLKAYKLSKASGAPFLVLHVDFLAVVVHVEVLVVVVVELVLHVYSFLPHKPQRLVYLFGSYKLVVAVRGLDKLDQKERRWL